MFNKRILFPLLLCFLLLSSGLTVARYIAPYDERDINQTRYDPTETIGETPTAFGVKEIVLRSLNQILPSFGNISILSDGNISIASDPTNSTITLGISPDANLLFSTLNIQDINSGDINVVNIGISENAFGGTYYGTWAGDPIPQSLSTDTNFQTANYVSVTGDSNFSSIGFENLFGGTYYTTLTEGSVLFAGNDGNIFQNNSSLFWSEIDERLSIGGNTGLDPRIGLSITGDVDIIHTATQADDHALEIDVDAAGFGDVKGIDIDYITGAISLGENEEVILINIDEFAATGGDVVAVEILATEGSAKIYGLEAGALVNPVVQLSGIFTDMDSALVNVTDRQAEFISIISDIAIFVANGDTVTIGSASKFEEIEFLLDTFASKDIQPTFEFSTGIGTWDDFTPADGTNGLRNTGVIAWFDEDIPTWAKGTGNEYLIKITRTRNNVPTVPIENKVQIASTIKYEWTKGGDLRIRDVNAERNVQIKGDLNVVGDINFGGSLAIEGIAFNNGGITATTYSGTGGGTLDASSADWTFDAHLDSSGRIVLDDLTSALSLNDFRSGYGIHLDTGTEGAGVYATDGTFIGSLANGASGVCAEDDAGNIVSLADGTDAITANAGVFKVETTGTTLTADLNVIGEGVNSALTIEQGADQLGTRIVGYGDMATEYFDTHIMSDGRTQLESSPGEGIYMAPGGTLVGWFGSTSFGFYADKSFIFGHRNDSNERLEHDSSWSNDCLQLGLNDNDSIGTDTRTLLIIDRGDMGFNYQHANQPDPTVITHSNQQTTDEWFSYAHNGEDANFSIGKGAFNFNGDVNVTETLILDRNFSIRRETDNQVFICGIDALGELTCN